VVGLERDAGLVEHGEPRRSESAADMRSPGTTERRIRGEAEDVEIIHGHLGSCGRGRARAG